LVAGGRLGSGTTGLKCGGNLAKLCKIIHIAIMRYVPLERKNTRNTQNG
jgi:hypothetical protein